MTAPARRWVAIAIVAVLVVSVLGAVLLGIGDGDGDDTGAPADGASSSSSGDPAADGSEEPSQEASAEPTTDAERLSAVIETQLDFEQFAPEVFGVVPEGLPAGVLPEDQDPNFVVGVGDAQGGWVVFVQNTVVAEQAVPAAAERLRQAGYVEGEPVPVSDTGELTAPAEADPAAFGDLRSFSGGGVVVGVASRDVEVGADVPLPSVTMLVVAPAAP
ncbi:hypothetical protein RDV89_07015 [Nocardioides zeae]|uniref:Secreted protein n=1 Tax=Nocardioides imazamoxiresistens TaxID=3231893 RepID=A0ABU3PUD1_9ACTN|nr:hypothetical protein [Nocardioides zeae]MDT9592811.1 hypothetical protein [Nocardioides zeae]